MTQVLIRGRSPWGAYGRASLLVLGGIGDVPIATRPVRGGIGDVPIATRPVRGGMGDVPIATRPVRGGMGDVPIATRPVRGGIGDVPIATRPVRGGMGDVPIATRPVRGGMGDVPIAKILAVGKGEEPTPIKGIRVCSVCESPAFELFHTFAALASPLRREVLPNTTNTAKDTAKACFFMRLYSRKE